MIQGIKVFSGMSVRDNALVIDDKHTPDCANVRIDNPIGALSNIKGIEKYNTSAFDSSITAMFQLKRTTLFGDVYTKITNVTELQAMENDLTANYYLANNIDASATSDWNSGLGFLPIGDIFTEFTGACDGNGYNVTDLFINRTGIYGGLFGAIANAVIKNIGMIDVDITTSGNAAGLIGRAVNSAIINTYSTGSVNSNYTGGLVSYIFNSTMTNGYSACIVSGANAGGLVARDSSGTYNDCFWDTETSGQASSAGGTGKTTAEMKKQATFTNWDFTDIWAIVEDTSYPTLNLSSLINQMDNAKNKSIFCLAGSKLYLI